VYLLLLDLIKQNSQTKDLEQFVGPICEKVKSGKLATKQGVSYLEAKLHVLLSYNINIAFYLMMKAEGRSVSDHPVIAQLVRCRTIMEKLRPLDAQLKQQLESLFRQAGNANSGSAGGKDSAMRPSIDDLEGMYMYMCSRCLYLRIYVSRYISRYVSRYPGVVSVRLCICVFTNRQGI
jgi:hypothetical protein